MNPKREDCQLARSPGSGLSVIRLANSGISSPLVILDGNPFPPSLLCRLLEALNVGHHKLTLA
jgi:hypothetical protein